MRDVISIIFDMWNRYWGESLYFLILLAVCAYLLLRRRNNETGRMLLAYQVIVAVVYFGPVTAWVIQKCIGWLVYWRVIWLFPVVPLIAYGFTHMTMQWKRKLMRTVCVFVLLGAVSFGGGVSVWQAGNYVKTANLQQIPDDVAVIAEVIAEKRSSEESLVAADDYVTSYLRVYDASIKMPYGREGRGAINPNARYLHRGMMAEKKSYRRIANRLIEENCEFVILKIPGKPMVQYMRKRGFRLLKKVGDYGVFQQIIE